MAEKHGTGPRVAGRDPGPRVAIAQPATPPTLVHLGNDRVLVEAREVDIAQIDADPDQPRKAMDPARLGELARSIADYGLLQPLVVRQAGMGRDGDMRYVVVAGGRRHAAIRLAIAAATDEDARRRLARVPVVVSETPAAERRVIQLIENLQREDLSPVEEARALKEILQLEGLTMGALATRIHRSQGYIDERLRLIRHEEIEQAVEAGLLTKSAGAAVASLAGAEARAAWLERARAGETIRPREIYASKPGRQQRPMAATAPTGNPAGAAGGTPSDGRPRHMPGTAPAAQDVSSPQPGDTRTDPARDEPATRDAEAATPHTPGSASPDDLRRAWRDGDGVARRALLEQLLGDAAPVARQVARRLLEAGALLGISSEALLDALDRP